MASRVRLYVLVTSFDFHRTVVGWRPDPQTRAEEAEFPSRGWDWNSQRVVRSFHRPGLCSWGPLVFGAPIGRRSMVRRCTPVFYACWHVKKLTMVQNISVVFVDQSTVLQWFVFMLQQSLAQHDSCFFYLKRTVCCVAHFISSSFLFKVTKLDCFSVFQKCFRCSRWRVWFDRPLLSTMRYTENHKKYF